MTKNIDVRVGRKTYSLAAETDQDKKDLMKASAALNTLADQFIQANPQMSNEEALMLTAISIAHEYERLKENKQSEERMLEQLHNSLAEKLENLL
jgi:cell division protein ZapA (FtsZ GTPase activity inhibitor)|tara:strand:- start:600 stop:884 length:285 start_codon:yes stop_codon:yes gene_type:complete